MLKNRLSEYVRLAAQGETVLVTDRDKVMAELIPPGQARSPIVSDAVFAEMIRSGIMTPALRPFNGPPKRMPIAPNDELLKELEEDRSDR